MDCAAFTEIDFNPAINCEKQQLNRGHKKHAEENVKFYRNKKIQTILRQICISPHILKSGMLSRAIEITM